MFNRHVFSPREAAIVKIIGRKKLTVEEITEKLFEGDKPRPFDVAISVGNCIRRIVEKCDHYKLNWTLDKEKQGNKHIISRRDL